jgi:hypothetical protein
MKLLPVSFFRLGGLAALVLGLALTGCGSDGIETVEVKGNVTLDGQPVPSGTISFVAKDGAVQTGGGVIKDGAYVAQTPPGDKWVMILATKVVGQEQVYAGDPNSPMRDVTEQITSPVYNAAHQTPLVANIDGPKEGLNFELTKDVKPRG